MQIFAHRGISRFHPENTMRAFQAALALPQAGIELDVYLHQGELVVIHDRFVDRTTNGSGPLEQLSVGQRQALDAGDGEPVPTLWQVLQLVNSQCLLNIELKGHDTALALLALLDRASQELHYDLSKILVSSFHHPLLATLRQQQPSLKLGVLIAHYPLDVTQLLAPFLPCSLHVDRAFIDQKLVEQAHQSAAKVYVYTVDNPIEAHELQQMGVDGLFCNDPAAMMAHLAG